MHEGVKYPCNQCDSKNTNESNLKRHKIYVHEGANIYAINVTQSLPNKVISRLIKCQYMKVSNIHAINVIQSLLIKVVSRYM